MVSAEKQLSNRGNEASILALFLQQEGAIHEALSMGVREAHFQERAHMTLFSGMVRDVKAGYSPDQGTLVDRHQLDIGPTRTWASFADLSRCVDSIARLRPRRAHLRKYVEELNEACCRKRIMS